MSAFISALLKLTVTGSILTLLTVLLRRIFQKNLPKTVVVALWIIVYAAFVIPVSIPVQPLLGNHSSAGRVMTAVSLPAVNLPSSVSDPTAATGAHKSGTKAVSSAAEKIQSVRPADLYSLLAVAYVGVCAMLITVVVILYFLTLRRFRKIIPVAKDRLFESCKKRSKVSRKIGFGVSLKASVPVPQELCGR